jgi:pyrroloquinoline quinone biosynthesis protein D
MSAEVSADMGADMSADMSGGLVGGNAAAAARLPTLATQPRVGPGFRLQWEAVQDCHVLLYPEGMVKLNRSAGEILQRCDGERDIAAVVADLELAFNMPGLQPDVLAFVQMAAEQRWLVWER